MTLSKLWKLVFIRQNIELLVKTLKLILAKDENMAGANL